MTQRRKKATTFQKQKIAKAQHRNEFIRKLKIVINEINGTEVSSTIPQAIINKLYDSRSHSFKIIPSDDGNIPTWILNDARHILSNWTKGEKIIIIPEKLQVTIEEFFTVVLTSSIYIHRLIPDDSATFRQLKEKYKEFNLSLENIFHQAYTSINIMLLTIAYYYNDLGKSLFWFKYELTPTPDLKNGIVNLITVYQSKLETSTVVIDDIRRPITRLGYAFPNSGVEYISIKPSALNIDNSFADIPHDVYIQSHALQRLTERIDCFPTGSLHHHMFQSLKEPSVFYDSHKNILIEFRYFDTKAGYFSVDITEGKIVIRTFLFVTNNNTPEGQKLERITGLKKLDKKFLGIDKLSTFMASDIEKNEEARGIFISAGCQCLLDLLEHSNLVSKIPSKYFNSNTMLRYISAEKEQLPKSMMIGEMLNAQSDNI